MSRVANNVLTEYQKAGYSFCYIIEIRLLTNDPLYLTTFNKSVVSNNKTYAPMGSLITIPTCSEESEIDFKSKKIVFSVPQDLLTKYILKLEGQGINKVIIIDTVVLNANNTVLGVYPYFRGKIARVQINKGNPYQNGQASANLTLNLGNAWLDTKEKRGRLTNNDMQQNISTGDLGYEFVQDVANQKDLEWGSTV